MPSRLKRYQTEGHDHFITFSCYHRLPNLNQERARIVFAETPGAPYLDSEMWAFALKREPFSPASDKIPPCTEALQII